MPKLMRTVTADRRGPLTVEITFPRGELHVIADPACTHATIDVSGTDHVTPADTDSGMTVEIGAPPPPRKRRHTSGDVNNVISGGRISGGSFQIGNVSGGLNLRDSDRTTANGTAEDDDHDGDDIMIEARLPENSTLRARTRYGHVSGEGTIQWDVGRPDIL